MKPIAQLFFLLGMTQSLFAQHTINGRIADQQNSGVRPLEQASMTPLRCSLKNLMPVTILVLF